MLPSPLLAHRQNGEEIVPKRLKIDAQNLAIANDSIQCFQSAVGCTQAELDRRLQDLEGDSPDYRIKRGLAHLLKSHFCTIEIVSPLEPQELRQRVFAAAANTVPGHRATTDTLEKLAHQLSRELKRQVRPDQVQTGLYADLKENRILTQFDAPEPADLLHRYNLSQVQGIFYRASDIVITAYRNVPGQYKLLFRYLKFFGLMFYIEGDADFGFTITIDGPTSLFKPSTRYGLAIAKLIPALLHVTRWSLKATLHERDFDGNWRTGRFGLDSQCGLVSHYAPGKPYDSAIEQSFAQRWEKMDPPWRLEREVDLIPIPGSLMIPDFRLVHPDGRDVLLEIVGYWRPEYLRKKFAQVRRANVRNLILAISERLNLEKAGVNTHNVPAQVIWFKDKLSPKVVLAALEEQA